MKEIRAIEVVKDRTDDARCNEGFLRLRRLEIQNLYSDGSRSLPYPCDIMSRLHHDAVAVVIYHQVPRTGKTTVFLREGIRPPLFFRKGEELPVEDPREYLTFVEIVAGLLEDGDRGEEGINQRAAIEVLEEAGISVQPDRVFSLGGPFFPSPGTTVEKIHLRALEIHPSEIDTPTGDGSPMEESGKIISLELHEAIEMSMRGEIEDVKTEIGLRRLADYLK